MTKYNHEKNLEQAKIIWEELGDIPVNNDNEIDAPFRGYSIGTDLHEIWADIEEDYNVSIHDDLMFQ